jgi:hypothetical protein
MFDLVAVTCFARTGRYINNIAYVNAVLFAYRRIRSPSTFLSHSMGHIRSYPGIQKHDPRAAMVFSIRMRARFGNARRCDYILPVALNFNAVGQFQF